MAIKEITYEKNDFINAGKISFQNSNIISLIGMNGSGKSQLLKWISEGKDTHKYKKIIAKNQRISISDAIAKYNAKGKNKIEFDKIKMKLENDSTTVTDMKNFIDDFFWTWYSRSLFPVLENNVSDKEFANFVPRYNKTKDKNFFSENAIEKLSDELDEFDSLSELVPYKKQLVASNEIHKIISDMFDATKITKININNFPEMQGRFHVSPMNNTQISLSQTLMRDGNFKFPLMLLKNGGYNIKSFTKHTYDSQELQDSFTEETQIKIQNWLSSYLSQNLIFTLNMDFIRLNWSITITNKYTPDTQLNFDQLSSGTQNLISLIYQVGEINDETIVLIDEPETGMHPMMQIQFRDFLESLSTKTSARFIVATHSLHFVKNGIETNGLYIVTNDENGSSIWTKKEYVEKNDILDTQIFDMVGYYIDKDNTKFDSSKPIIVVEGDTDIIYIKKMAMILDIELDSFAITRTKLGGAANMLKTSTLLSAVHDYKKDKIILSPDWDIVNKHQKVFNDIKNGDVGRLVMLGEKDGDVESMFDPSDGKYICPSGNKNAKMNRANLFWRDTITRDDLNKQTILKFTTYFKEVGLLS